MACAIPVITSPIGANVDAVSPTCGTHASSSDEWLGAAGSRWVEERYSLRSALPVLAGVIRQAAGKAG